MKPLHRLMRRRDDDAVSPVIAVILMVAITVVLAATVYVWVSGFSGSGSSPAKTLAMSSSGSIADGDKIYTVASATPGTRWSDLTFTVDGTPYALTTTGACGDDLATAGYRVCSGGATETSAGTVDAGDQIRIGGDAGAGALSGGQTLRVLDSQANSVVLTLTVG